MHPLLFSFLFAQLGVFGKMIISFFKKRSSNVKNV